MASARSQSQYQSAVHLLDHVAPVAEAPELTVVVPTLNERSNPPDLVQRLTRALDGVRWEVVFVDDNSVDGTTAEICGIAQHDARVRCIRRVGRRGLSGACIEGVLASHGRHVAIMDADLQHDETLLPVMLARMRKADLDLVVASRYAGEGSSAGLSAARARISRWSTALVRRVLGVDIGDPMSGFFMVRREVIDALAPSLSTSGFKILLDILATAPRALRTAEIPYSFRQRLRGESKLDSRVALDFLALLVAKLSNDTISFRFVLFCLVGLSGVGFHMAVLALVHAAALDFDPSQAIATAAAIAWNFAWNNRLTYRDQRMVGWNWVTGLVRFEIICSVGAISNVGAASWLYDRHPTWWLAGVCGALMGAVWNYTVSAALVWRDR